MPANIATFVATFRTAVGSANIESDHECANYPAVVAAVGASFGSAKWEADMSAIFKAIATAVKCPNGATVLASLNAAERRTIDTAV